MRPFAALRVGNQRPALGGSDGCDPVIVKLTCLTTDVRKTRPPSMVRPSKVSNVDGEFAV
jgi:hypothetical protein